MRLEERIAGRKVMCEEKDRDRHGRIPFRRGGRSLSLQVRPRVLRLARPGVSARRHWKFGRVTLCNPFATVRSNRAMTRFQRSLQIWSLLVCAARDRRTYTYGELAGALGMGGAGVTAQFLDPIMHYCLQQQFPPLTVLVVNRNTGLPGEGLTTLENVNLDRERVFTHDWFQMEPPETGDFERAVAA